MNINPPYKGSGRYKRWFCQGMLGFCLLVMLSGAVLHPPQESISVMEMRETAAARRAYTPADLKLVSPLQWDEG